MVHRCFIPKRFLRKKAIFHYTLHKSAVGHRPTTTLSVALSGGAGLCAGLALSEPRAAAPIAIAAAVVLLTVLRRQNSFLHELRAFSVFACSFLIGALFWVGLGIYRPPANDLGDTLLVCGVLVAFHTALYCVCFATLRAGCRALQKRGMLALAACTGLGWTSAEVIRTMGFWALPWGLLGYSQVDNAILRGLYPIAGSAGIALAIWAIAAACIQSIQSFRQSGRLFKLTTAWVLACIAGWSLQHVAWTRAMEHPITVRLVHTHWPEDTKYNPTEQLEAMAALYAAAQNPEANIVVFPELFLVQRPRVLPANYRRAVAEAARISRVSLLFGMPGLAFQTDIPGTEGGAQQNTLIHIDGAETAKTYVKELLLPFTEYLPDTPALSWAYPYLYRYPLADFLPGASVQPPLIAAGVALGPTICSELAYPGKAARQAIDASLLVNVSSDSWIESNFYVAQALTIARVRAAEAQKPLVRANNVGFSAFIDANGQILSSLIGHAGNGTMDIQPRSGATPYVRIAAWLSQ